MSRPTDYDMKGVNMATGRGSDGPDYDPEMDAESPEQDDLHMVVMSRRLIIAENNLQAARNSRAEASEALNAAKRNMDTWSSREAEAERERDEILIAMAREAGLTGRHLDQDAQKSNAHG